MNYKADLLAALHSIPWFLELNQEQLERLAGISNICQIKANVEIFPEGGIEDYLYIVLEGQVATEIYVPTRGQVHLFTAEPLDIIGWSSLTPVVRQRTSNARTLEPSRLIAFEAEGLRRLCDEDHHLGYIIMRRLSNVVASRLLTTRLQLLDMIVHPVPANSTAGALLE
ncbi:MAG: Crp/Fnr family transcriptional regulator [Chloroflexi bacterium]|nr:Crp/Fnr family transcriptional regulator [Chloroflexota bacterium]